MSTEITRRSLLRLAAGSGAAALGGWKMFLSDHTHVAQEIIDENAKPGAFGWLNPTIDAQIMRNMNGPDSHDSGQAGQATGVNPEAQMRVAGYADSMSINTGESTTFRVTSQLGSYKIAILRMGWYGGAGATEVYRSGVLTGVNYPTPSWDSNGLVACGWPAAISVSSAGWTTGYYLAALIPQSTGVAESYVPFVVRNDSSTAPILMQIPFTTYQAYNSWGGKSSYGGPDGVRARKLSFDRPYSANGGTMYLFAGDHQMISWLERNGYQVSYAASSDTHQNPALMTNRSLFLSVYHDEYWSQSMRNNLTSWIGNSKSVGMLSANNFYWRIRFEPSSSGVANRVMACYKDAAIDPNTAEPTILFSEVGQNESQIEGLQFASFGDVTAPWIVTNAGHWIYSGTGVSNGTAIPGLVGTEWDQATASAPSGTQLIASSPTTGAYGPSVQAAAVREPSSGQVIFSAGTVSFPMFFGGYNSPGEDARVSKMMTNFLARTIVSVDTTTPAVTVIVPAPGQAFTTKPITISGTAADNVGVVGVYMAIYRPGAATGSFWNGTAWQSEYTSVPATLAAPGATATGWTYAFNPPQTGGYYYFSAVALDAKSNYSYTPWTSFLLTDTIAPTATLTPANNATTSGTFAISGTATDNNSVYAVYIAVYRLSTAEFWNGITWQATFATVPATLNTPGTPLTTYAYNFTPPAPGPYLIAALPIDANYNYTFTPWNTVNAT
jgi:Bacterial Ig domain